jgi:hypothetical protein
MGAATFGTTVTDGGLAWTCEDVLEDYVTTGHTYPSHARVIRVGDCRFYYETELGGTTSGGGFDPFAESYHIPDYPILDGTTTGRTGTTVTISSVVGTSVTLNGLSGMVAGDVGKVISLTNAANFDNNVPAYITSFISPTSIVVNIQNAVQADANNGSIHWEVFKGIVWKMKIPAGIFCRTQDVKVRSVNIEGFMGCGWPRRILQTTLSIILRCSSKGRHLRAVRR